jgi:hypothetical protein
MITGSELFERALAGCSRVSVRRAQNHAGQRFLVAASLDYFGSELAYTASPARTHWSFLLPRFLMNEFAGWFVQKVVLAARIVASKSVGHPTHTVAELQRQIHDDLRRQHPEWIEPGGESPMCDFYEARLRRLLETCARSGPAEAA